MRKRSKYRPKPVVKPLGIKNLVTLEMPGRIGQIALGQEWLDMQHLRDIGSHSLLAERVAKAVGDDEKLAQAREIASICVACEDRFDRTGRAGTSGPEMIRLRELLDETLPWINSQPNLVIYRESEALVKKYDRLVEHHNQAQATGN